MEDLSKKVAALSSYKEWQHVSSEYLIQQSWFKMRQDRVIKGNGQEMFPYYVLEYTNWACVFPITTDGKIVLVKQYRYALGQWSIELPGGIMDAHETDPLEAGRRELLEETGYSCSELVQVAAIAPNPATQNNLMYCFVAKDCELTQLQSFDENEELEVMLATMDEVKTLLREQKIVQSLHTACMMYALEYLGQLKW
jgi:8-oxo-dGTP pyrophosphatase MutT (NUDIX family)